MPSRQEFVTNADGELFLFDHETGAVTPATEADRKVFSAAKGGISKRLDLDKLPENVQVVTKKERRILQNLGTHAGKIATLRKWGYEDVKMQRGRIAATHPKTGQRGFIDPPQAEMADITDLGDEVAFGVGVPLLAAAGGPFGVATGALGAAGIEAARQGLGTAAGMTDNIDPTAILGAGAVQGAVPAATKAVGTGARFVAGKAGDILGSGRAKNLGLSVASKMMELSDTAVPATEALEFAINNPNKPVRSFFEIASDLAQMVGGSGAKAKMVPQGAAAARIARGSSANVDLRPMLQALDDAIVSGEQAGFENATIASLFATRAEVLQRVMKLRGFTDKQTEQILNNPSALQATLRTTPAPQAQGIKQLLQKKSKFVTAETTAPPDARRATRTAAGVARVQMERALPQQFADLNKEAARRNRLRGQLLKVIKLPQDAPGELSQASENFLKNLFSSSDPQTSQRLLKRFGDTFGHDFLGEVREAQINKMLKGHAKDVPLLAATANFRGPAVARSLAAAGGAGMLFGPYAAVGAGALGMLATTPRGVVNTSRGVSNIVRALQRAPVGQTPASGGMSRIVASQLARPGGEMISDAVDPVELMLQELLMRRDKSDLLTPTP